VQLCTLNGTTISHIMYIEMAARSVQWSSKLPDWFNLCIYIRQLQNIKILFTTKESPTTSISMKALQAF